MCVVSPQITSSATAEPRIAPVSHDSASAGRQPTPWLRSDLTRQRAGKALHYGAGLPRFVLVAAGDGWAVGSATGSEVVDLEEWARRERVPMPLAADLAWLRG